MHHEQQAHTPTRHQGLAGTAARGAESQQGPPRAEVIQQPAPLERHVWVELPPSEMRRGPSVAHEAARTTAHSQTGGPAPRRDQQQHHHHYFYQDLGLGGAAPTGPAATAPDMVPSAPAGLPWAAPGSYHHYQYHGHHAPYHYHYFAAPRDTVPYVSGPEPQLPPGDHGFSYGLPTASTAQHMWRPPPSLVFASDSAHHAFHHDRRHDQLYPQLHGHSHIAQGRVPPGFAAASTAPAAPPEPPGVQQAHGPSVPPSVERSGASPSPENGATEFHRELRKHHHYRASTSAPSTDVAFVGTHPPGLPPERAMMLPHRVPPRRVGDASKTAPVSPDDPEGNESKARQIIVSNLPKSVSDAELHRVFASFGPIEAARIRRNERGGSLRYGFVYYMTHEDACSAIDTLSGQMWDGGDISNSAVINVEWSTQRGKAKPGEPGYRAPSVPTTYKHGKPTPRTTDQEGAAEPPKEGQAHPAAGAEESGHPRESIRRRQ